MWRALLWILWMPWAAAANPLSDAEKSLQQNQNARTTLQAAIDKGSKEARLIDAELGQIASALESAKTRVQTIRAAVADAESAVRASEAAVEAAEARLVALQAAYRAETRAFYLTGQTLIESPVADDAGVQAAYLPFVLAAREARAAEIQRETRALTVAQQQQADALATAQALARDATDRERTLAQTQQRNATLLAQLQRDLSTQQAKIEALSADQNRLETLIKELKSIPSGSALAPYKGRLMWPADGLISHRFGSARDDGFGTWQGLVISTRGNAQVTAVQGGQVAYAGYLLVMGWW